MRRIQTLAMIVLLAVFGCGKSTPDTLVTSGYDQQEMDAAIARARSEIEFFIGELSKPTGTNYSVKAPIEEGGKTEHFWLTEVSLQNNEFKGTIGNEPGIVGNVKMGQSWMIKKTAISDWMFMRDGKIYGNYTMRPLLRTLPAEEAEKYRSIHADP